MEAEKFYLYLRRISYDEKWRYSELVSDSRFNKIQCSNKTLK